MVGFSMAKRALLIIAALSLVACGGIPVSTDYDTARQFSQLSTYAWMTPKEKLIIDPLVDNDLTNKRVERAVESQLAARGFQKAIGGQSADFLVTYHVSAETKQTVSNFHGHYGYYPCWRGCYSYGGLHSDVYTREYKEGTFMIDVIDPASSELIWRGISGRRLSSKTPQERDAFIRETVAAILAEFPPKSM